MILKTKFSLSILAYSDFSFVKKFKIPVNTKDAGVSPGCTLLVKNTVGLSNLYGLFC